MDFVAIIAYLLYYFPKGNFRYLVWTKVIHPFSNKEGIREIGYSMTMVLDTKRSNFESQEWLRFYIWFIMKLYYEMRQLFYYKMWRTFIIKCIRFFIKKMRQFYYEMRYLLQNGLILLENVAVVKKCGFITKCVGTTGKTFFSYLYSLSHDIFSSTDLKQTLR